MPARLLLFALLVGALLGAAPARAVNGTLLGGINWSSVNDENDSYRRTNAFMGGGELQFVFRTFSTNEGGSLFYLGVDFGLFYVQRKYYWKLSGGSETTQFATVELPIQLRAWVFPFLSLAGGAYVSQAIGQATYTIAGTSSSIDPPLKTDYGVVGSFRFAPDLEDSYRWFFLEARALLGLASYGGNSPAYFSDYRFLIGISLGRLPHDYYRSKKREYYERKVPNY